MDLKTLINNFQTLLNNGYESAKAGGLDWLNDVCHELTIISRYLHKFLIFDCKANDRIVQTCFLCLNQMICCIKYLEKALIKEQESKVVLASTRQHFLDRLLWCLSQLNTTIALADDGDEAMLAADAPDMEPSFVVYMDMVLDLLQPLSIYSTRPSQQTNVSEQKAEYMRESAQIRTLVEHLIGTTLTFANVVSTNERMALTTMCQKVMRDCIAFQEECSLDKAEKNTSTQDKRMLAQVLEGTLFKLDKLVNDSLLHMVYDLFAKLDQNPIQTLRHLSPLGNDEPDQNVIDQEVEKFDMLLDQMIQVGSFAVSYASTAKLKSNLRSCLASCEALDACLVPSVFAIHSETHSKLLEQHWREEVTYFRRCVQEIIDSDAFCMILIDEMSDAISELNQTFNAATAQRIIAHADVLLEHLQLNYNELKLHIESPAKLFFDDFKLMLNECKAIARATEPIEDGRRVKRLRILRSVLKKFEATLVSRTTTENSDSIAMANEQSFTFGNATQTRRRDIIRPWGQPKITDSMAVVVDLDEFVKSFEAKQPQRNSVFYQSKRRRQRPPLPSAPDKTLSPNLKKNIKSPKRSSKRTSLRVAMFKRQKSLETQKFLGSYLSNSTDTMNLQITDILDQLTDLSGSLASRRLGVPSK